MQISDWVVYIRFDGHLYSCTLVGPISVQKVRAQSKKFLREVFGQVTEEFINNSFVFYLIEKIKVCIISLKT